MIGNTDIKFYWKLERLLLIFFGMDISVVKSEGLFHLITYILLMK